MGQHSHSPLRALLTRRYLECPAVGLNERRECDLSVLGIHLTHVLLKTQTLQERQYIQLQGLALPEVIRSPGLGLRLLVLRMEASPPPYPPSPCCCPASAL